ncbi:MAG: CDP-diacylglycerol-serine O-phosphatidyltransferase [Acidobacteria bacterium]|nr:CDP-diacylglycerol-serine O-phosphatidyltransferase [Acidobacteriota bacterium]
MQLELARDHQPRPPHPLRRRTSLQRRRFRRGVYLLPSVFTLGNMFCGYICLVYSIRGDFETAAPFVAFSVLLDILDGRIARLTGSTSAFGVEFDSLADVISFGVAPAILTVSWGLAPLGRLGWAAGFIFVTAGAIRLARFNIQTSTDKRYFVGMPIPAAAAVPASTVYVYPAGLQEVETALPALALMIVPAILMVSTIRFRSFKSVDLRARRSYKVLLALALVLVAVATHPRWTLLILAYGYLLSAFVGLAVTRFRRRGGGAAPPPPAAEPAPATGPPEE